MIEHVIQIDNISNSTFTCGSNIIYKIGPICADDFISLTEIHVHFMSTNCIPFLSMWNDKEIIGNSEFENMNVCYV